MILNRHERDFYRVEVTTDPQITGWEATFDDGATWAAGEVDPTPGAANTWRWLVAGPRAEVGTAVAVITQATWPDVRAVDNPTIAAENAPPIFLT